MVNGRGKLLLLVLILLGLIITASLVSAGEVSYITNPQTGELIGIVDDTGTYIIYSAPDGTAMFVTDQDGNVVYTREIDFDGVILSESGEDQNGVIDRSIGWDEDIQEYLRSDGTVDFSTDGVWLGLHWPTAWERIGPSLANLGTLGIYHAVQEFSDPYGPALSEPGAVLGRMTDAVPIAGGVKAAIQAENSADRWGAISSTVGTVGLIGAGGMAAAGKSKVFYVDPNGVTIVSKRGVPSAGAFRKGVAGAGVATASTVLFAEWPGKVPFEVFIDTRELNLRVKRAISIMEDSNWRSKKLDLIKVTKDARVKPMTFIQMKKRPHSIGLFDTNEPGIIRINTEMRFTDKELAATLLHEGIHRRDFLLGKPMYRAVWEYKAYRSTARFIEEELGLPLDWRELIALKGRDPFMQDVAQHRRRWKMPPGEKERSAWRIP